MTFMFYYTFYYNTIIYVIRIIERFHIFTLFYRLSELKSREYIVKAIIKSLDYQKYVLLKLCYL